MTTFAIDPERYSVAYRRRVLASSPESGMVHRRQANTAVFEASERPEARVWTLEWEYASLADWQAVQGYYDDTSGGTLPLTWTEPQALSTVQARMIDFDSTSAHQQGGVRMRVVLEEIP